MTSNIYHNHHNVCVRIFSQVQFFQWDSEKTALLKMIDMRYEVKEVFAGENPSCYKWYILRWCHCSYMSGGDNPAGNGGHSERWDSQSDSFWQREIQAWCEVIFI